MSARDGGRVEERLAAHRRPARLDEVAVGRGLEHVARRARPSAPRRSTARCRASRASATRSSGRRRVSSARRLQPGHAAASRRRAPRGRPRSRSAELDGLGAVARLGHHRQVGLGVEHHAAGRGGPSGGRRRAGSASSAGRSLVAPRAAARRGAPRCRRRRTAPRVSRPPTSSARSRMPPMPVAGVGRPRGEPAPVVAHDQPQRRRPRCSSASRHLGRAGVAHHVGQALLGHPVDDQLDLRAAAAASPSRAGAPRAGPRAPPRSWQSARSALCRPEVVERLRPQLARDPAHLLEARAPRA